MTSPWEKPSPSSDPYQPPAGFGEQPGHGTPPGYGAQPGYGTPAPTGGAVVGPGGEWTGPPLASWGTRAGGYLIDFGIIFAASLVAGFLSDSLSTLVNLGLFVYFGYLTGTTGQTPGRQVVGAKVVRLSDGQVLGAGAGIGRAFLHFLDSLPLLLGWFWPIWDKKNQTFADKIISSVVLKV